MKAVVSNLLVLFFSLTVFSCQNEPVTPSSGFATSWEVNANAFIAATSQTTGDPFVIKKAVLNDSLLKVTVQYGGGCKKHDFKLVWDGTIDSSTIPAVANFALIHDGNNDMCEALPTEELTFDLLDIMQGNRPIEGFQAWVVNASNKEEVLAISESAECGWAVETISAVCGTGIWDNLWFQTLRTEQAGGVRAFLLQPVSVAEGVVVPENAKEGTKYYIGARIIDDYEPGVDDVVCLAYPGDHYSIEITCIQPYE
ncbi:MULTISPECIES: hypothetical protein [unclassified Imperialibacter]|uniref:hypothetical protein n=1 Tax=unclassified Imperialibacter TaxID=2629706 RepID=UPI0012551D10|nr:MULTISPECIES: hypothetical protein [unclassified Imperialibacter]CAD5273794.1 conserved exported hypothetical protein [Imperialibacter sp. 75]CAD5274162.1 conserved exported hypothetical protein [Imperialibacter sp. 89]VVT22628.1 conserved exported hypothetical protein [Imperialibacter sp. EC-SDR9]